PPASHFISPSIDPTRSTFLLSSSGSPRYLHCFPTRRSSDLCKVDAFKSKIQAHHLTLIYCPNPGHSLTLNARYGTSSATINKCKIGRAHVLTPVTLQHRIPYSA